MKRFRVSGPHGDRKNNPYRWTVIDTQDRNIAVDSCRTKADAIDSARELNEDPWKLKTELEG